MKLTRRSISYMAGRKPAPGGLAGKALPRNAHGVGHKGLCTAATIHEATACSCYTVCVHTTQMSTRNNSQAPGLFVLNDTSLHVVPVQTGCGLIVCLNA